MKCDCHFDLTDGKIVHCPLHGAAKELLKALENSARVLLDVAGHEPHFIQLDELNAMNRAAGECNDAIALATGKEKP